MFKFKIDQMVWIIKDNIPKCGIVKGRCYEEIWEEHNNHTTYTIRFEDNLIIENSTINENELSVSSEELIQKIKNMCTEELSKQC